MRSFPKLSLIKDPTLREALRLIFDRLGTLDDERAPTTALTPSGTTTSARTTRITNVVDPVDPQDVVTLRYFNRVMQNVVSTRIKAIKTTPAAEELAPSGNRVLTDETGAVFDYIGLTQLSLFRFWLIGDTTTIDAVCTYAQTNGYTILRCIGMLAHPFWVGEGLDFDPNHAVAGSPANYYAQWPRFADHIAAFGLRLEAVLFADIDYLPYYQDSNNRMVHAQTMAETMAGKRAFFEIINEPAINGLASAAELSALAARVKAADPSRKVALGADIDDGLLYNIPPADYLTFHVERPPSSSWSWVVAHANYAPVIQTDRYPISDEPMPGDAVSTPHDENPDHYFGFGATARLVEIGSTFHYDDGLRGLAPTGVADTCAQAYRAGMAHIPYQFGGTIFYDDGVGSPFSYPPGSPQPTRIIGRVSGTTIKLIVLEAPPAWSPTVKSGYAMQAVEVRNDCEYWEGVTPGGGGGGGGGINTCDDAPANGHIGGALDYTRARLVSCGCGNEFPQLRVPTATQAEHLANAEELLRRIIWHEQQAGFVCGKQRNPSGAISPDKIVVQIAGTFRAFDVFVALGDNTRTLVMQFDEQFPASYVADPGIAD